MALISKEKIYLKNHGEFIKKITYSNGCFRVLLPDIIIADLNLKYKACELVANSEDAVNNLFFSKVKEWENSIAHEEKVIIFNAKFQGALLKKENWNDWDNGKYVPYGSVGTSYNKSQGCWEFFAADISIVEPGLGLLFIWGVYSKRTINNNSDYKYISGRNIDTRNMSKFTQIPHTDEREQFFLNLDESFARMIAKVYEALGNLTPDKLTLLADSGLKLLN